MQHLRMSERPDRWTLAQALHSRAWQNSHGPVHGFAWRQAGSRTWTSLWVLQAWIFAALDDEAQAAKFYTLAALYSLPAVRSALELRLDGFTIFSIVACAIHVQVRGRAAFSMMHALALCRRRQSHCLSRACIPQKGATWHFLLTGRCGHVCRLKGLPMKRCQACKYQASAALPTALSGQPSRSR